MKNTELYNEDVYLSYWQIAKENANEMNEETNFIDKTIVAGYLTILNPMFLFL
jgi:hypothetical protein